MECLPSLFLFYKYKLFASRVLVTDNYILNKIEPLEGCINDSSLTLVTDANLTEVLHLFRVIVPVTAEMFVKPPSFSLKNNQLIVISVYRGVEWEGWHGFKFEFV